MEPSKGALIASLAIGLWVPALAATREKSTCIEIPGGRYLACLFQDSRLAGSKTDRYWGTGQDDTLFGSSRLEIAKGGKSVLKIDLSPLARIGLDSLAAPGSLLVTEDFTSSMGSYSGPATKLLSFSSPRPAFEKLRDGRDLVLTNTGKSAWKETGKGFLQIDCHPDFNRPDSSGDPEFVTEYTRLTRTPKGWSKSTLAKDEFWENEAAPGDSLDPIFEEGKFPTADSRSPAVNSNPGSDTPFGPKSRRP